MHNEFEKVPWHWNSEFGCSPTLVLCVQRARERENESARETGRQRERERARMRQGDRVRERENETARQSEREREGLQGEDQSGPLCKSFGSLPRLPAGRGKRRKLLLEEVQWKRPALLPSLWTHRFHHSLTWTCLSHHPLPNVFLQLPGWWRQYLLKNLFEYMIRPGTSVNVVMFTTWFKDTNLWRFKSYVVFLFLISYCILLLYHIILFVYLYVSFAKKVGLVQYPRRGLNRALKEYFATWTQGGPKLLVGFDMGFHKPPQTPKAHLTKWTFLY